MIVLLCFEIFFVNVSWEISWYHYHIYGFDKNRNTLILDYGGTEINSLQLKLRLGYTPWGCQSIQCQRTCWHPLSSRIGLLKVDHPLWGVFKDLRNWWTNCWHFELPKIWQLRFREACKKGGVGGVAVLKHLHVRNSLLKSL